MNVSGVEGWRNPTTGIAACCARAAIGHAAAAPPSSVMNVRRPIIRSPSSAVETGYGDARSNEKPYSAMRAAAGGLHRLGGSRVSSQLPELRIKKVVIVDAQGGSSSSSAEENIGFLAGMWQLRNERKNYQEAN